VSAFKGKAGITVDERYETSETICAVTAWARPGRAPLCIPL